MGLLVARRKNIGPGEQPVVRVEMLQQVGMNPHR